MREYQGPAPSITTGTLTRSEHELVRAELPRDEGDAAEFVYWTGWRYQEALALTWDAIDESSEVIRYNDPRTGQRTVPYSAMPELRKLLRARTLVRGTAALVFHRAGKPLRQFRRAWGAACVAAGLGDQRRPREYRLRVVRDLVRAQESTATINELIGWKMTMSLRIRLWGPVTLEDLRDAMRRYGSHMSGDNQ